MAGSHTLRLRGGRFAAALAALSSFTFRGWRPGAKPVTTVTAGRNAGAASFAEIVDSGRRRR